MTEEDTFKALRQTPFDEMKELYYNWCKSLLIGLYSQEREDFFNEHGWTYDEYIKAHYNNEH